MIQIQDVQDYFSKHKMELFFVGLIFLLAFGIRAHLMIYDLMFGFDPYFHARIAEYVVQNFAIPSVDPLAYFQVEGGATLPETGFFWFFTAILYKIFTLGAAFSKESWISATKFFPAFFGAVISVAMYYLGKQMYGRKAGVTMALFAAVVPSFVYRTMAGFFEEDSLGFLWLVVGLIFFVRAVQKAEFHKDTIKDAVIAAFFFILMAWTWQMFIIIPIILVAWFPSTIVLMWFRKEPQEKMFNLAKNFAITFVLFSVFASALVGTGWIGSATGYVSSYLPVTPDNVTRINTPGGDGTSVYSISVGEEQRGFGFWGNKYSALIIFPVLALLIFIPYRLLRKKNDYVTFIAMYWIIITAFMAFIRLKFTYAFGLPVAVAAGITLHEMFNWVGDRQGFEKKLIAFPLGFMFLVGIAAGSFFVSQNVPSIEQNTGWKESLLWMKDNTPVDAKFFNWWDEGHWVTFIAERGVSTDNRNYTLQANSDMAQFILAPTKEAADAIITKYNPDYVLLSEDLIGKMPSLSLYALNIANTNDPRIQQYHPAVAMPCYVTTDSLSGQQTFNCGGNKLSAEQYSALPTTWQSQPNQIINAGQRGFVYRNESNSKLFILGGTANNTMIVKLFFKSPEVLDKFELVHSNNEVRIFKVK